MNLKLSKMMAIVVIVAVMLTPMVGEAHEGPPKAITKKSTERNSLIDAGRSVTTTVLMQADGKLVISDVLKNKVKLNGYKSKTWLHVLDKDGNVIRRITLTNWAEGTWMPGPSKRLVEKVVQLSEEESKRAVDVKIVHTQRGVKAPNVLNRMEKEIEFVTGIAK